MSGLLSYAFTAVQFASLDTQVCKYLRALMKGKACQKLDDGTFGKMSNSDLFYTWRILPFELEVAVRRVGWLQSMIRYPDAHRQVVGAVFGTFECAGGRVLQHAVLDREGRIMDKLGAEFAKSFSTALWLCEGTSGTDDLFWRMGKITFFLGEIAEYCIC